jgi:peptidyl-prolyl cis-trans isomerase B (cyclophilin B)
MRRFAAAGLLVAAVLAAGCSTRTGGEAVSSTSAPSTSRAATPSAGDAGDSCRFVESPGQDAPAGLPPDEDVTASQVVLATDSGTVTIALQADDAPCTVRSFVHLTGKKFYDGTVCHRLTTAAALKVLQCGDPDGNGTGGPGYTIPDELPTSLPAAEPDASGQQLVTYPRGTVAMANAGPDTGGSQFFLVYADSTLPPSYAVFGTVDPTGLATLDAIAKRGIGPGAGSPEDGPPAKPVKITTATVG